ncbi:putative cupin superfamily sugar epimerase [Paenibacillus shirakamiensis]|uniref:Cupin superfamily sugar epimerase n=1 Tax=Paenibacillus shirakamiensis TaxID=1265935 RepID=A0ABS4JJI1_9BACL|nr:cupin domain-containing protein [Paenibacillus shirakamiensis]MBP2001146.1 putative cupin superfamily sugar epimerase [Paenibacillus shirakamiensis]
MSNHEISPLVEALQLSPHQEGGWYKELWKSSFDIPHELLDSSYSGPRPAATSIYFLLHPHEFSEWHTVLSDEIWFWHSGSPLLLTLGGDGDQPGDKEEIILGPDILQGQRPQALVPAKVWQTARPLGNEPVFVSCVVSPGFHYDDFRLIDKSQK